MNADFLNKEDRINDVNEKLIDESRSLSFMPLSYFLSPCNDFMDI